jgi:hypothetical protein
MNREYNSSITRAKPCYSNLYEYDVNGMTSHIQIPVPVTIQPQLFLLARPHKMPAIPPPKVVFRCGQYKTGSQCE